MSRPYSKADDAAWERGKAPVDREAGLFAESPTWETHRQPDAVRAAALANAGELISRYGDLDGARLEDQGLTMAKAFEAFLTGEEAHGS
jgi:hypothetical protein